MYNSIVCIFKENQVKKRGFYTPGIPFKISETFVSLSDKSRYEPIQLHFSKCFKFEYPHSEQNGSVSFNTYQNISPEIGSNSVTYQCIDNKSPSIFMNQ